MLIVQMYSDTNYGIMIGEIEDRWDHVMQWDSRPGSLQIFVPHELHEQDSDFSDLVADLGGQLIMN